MTIAFSGKTRYYNPFVYVLSEWSATSLAISIFLCTVVLEIKITRNSQAKKGSSNKVDWLIDEEVVSRKYLLVSLNLYDLKSLLAKFYSIPRSSTVINYE